MLFLALRGASRMASVSSSLKWGPFPTWRAGFGAQS